MNANLEAFLIALAIAAVYWAFVKALARRVRMKRRVDDHPLEYWANDGGSQPMQHRPIQKLPEPKDIAK